MNVFLWIVQAILAGKYPWMQDFSQATVRFIGVMELLGAIGLIVPAAAGIAPVLTPLAGTGLAVIAVLAAAVHVRRKEPSGVAVSAILFALAALVAWGRFGPYSW